MASIYFRLTQEESKIVFGLISDASWELATAEDRGYVIELLEKMTQVARVGGWGNDHKKLLNKLKDLQ